MNEQASPAAPRKRAWFQLHLSTCVVLMLAAGVLVWANVKLRVRESFVREITFLAGDYQGHESSYHERGWPVALFTVTFERSYDCKLTRQPSPLESVIPLEEISGTSKVEVRGSSWNVVSCLIDLFCALGILAVIGLGSECLLRRRRKSGSSA